MPRDDALPSLRKPKRRKATVRKRYAIRSRCASSLSSVDDSDVSLTPASPDLSSSYSSILP